jgi:hypothetical protein
MSHRRAPDAGREVARGARGTTDAVVDLAMDIENTCRIPREELLGLLNTMTPFEQQRITAEMAAVQPPEDGEQETPAAALPADLVIKSRPLLTLTRTRLFVIAASFALSFGLGLVVALL